MSKLCRTTVYLSCSAGLMQALVACSAFKPGHKTGRSDGDAVVKGEVSTVSIDSQAGDAAAKTAAANAAANAGESMLVSAGTSKPRLADRVYTNALLHAVFGASIDQTIAPLVTSNIASFGGPCDPFGAGDTYCHGNFAGSLAAAMPSTMATRSGYQMLACEQIATSDAAITNAVGLIPSADVKALPTSAGINQAYALFYRGAEPEAPVQAALANVVAGQAPLDGWRYLFLTICLSPDWQLL